MEQPNEQQIEDFLFNRLPQTEADDIRAKAVADPDFARILAQRELEVAAMAIAEEEEIITSMANWRIADIPEQAAKPPLRVVHRRRSFTRILSIAAGVLFLIFAGTTFFASNNYSDAALANRYIESRIAGERGTDDANRLAPMKALMVNGEYAKALTNLKDIPGNAAAMLRGEALLKLERFDESITAYEVVMKSNSQLADEAAYQRAIVLLAAERTDAAKSAFEEITVDSANTYRQNAEQVLTAMDGFWRKFSW